MYGAMVRPRWHAFLASRPAPNMTEGLEVLVQLVIAEITTEPANVHVEWQVKVNYTCIRGGRLSRVG